MPKATSKTCEWLCIRLSSLSTFRSNDKNLSICQEKGAVACAHVEFLKSSVTLGFALYLDFESLWTNSDKIQRINKFYWSRFIPYFCTGFRMFDLPVRWKSCQSTSSVFSPPRRRKKAMEGLFVLKPFEGKQQISKRSLLFTSFTLVSEPRMLSKQNGPMLSLREVYWDFRIKL